MDKQFLLPNSLVPDYKLTKSASFSELSSKKKIVIEKQYQTQTHGNLLKQYSCEQIFDTKSNTSQIKISQTLKTKEAEHVDTWEKTVPACNFSTNSSWFNNSNKQAHFPRSISSGNHNLRETNNVSSRAVISPAKFLIDENKLNQLSIMPQSNVGDDKRVYLQNRNSNEPNYLFKKPLALKQNSEREKSYSRTNIPKSTNGTSKLSANDENRQHELDTFALKKRLRSLVAVEPKKKCNTYRCWPLVLFTLLPVAVIFLALVLSSDNNSNGFCRPRFHLQGIAQELKKQVFDQDVAINELAKFFDDKDNSTSFEVVVFVGGIGVGKSYTAEIIKSKIKDSDTMFDIFPPIYNKEEEVYKALSVCHCNLIRLENLKTDDMADAASFISKLKIKADKYCILVLALFNTEEVDYRLKRTIDYDRSISMIKDTFGEARLQPSIITFTPLSSAALMKCIKAAGDYSNVKLSNDDIEYVMSDLLSAESGCKGAYAKVHLVGKT